MARRKRTPDNTALKDRKVDRTVKIGSVVLGQIVQLKGQKSCWAKPVDGTCFVSFKKEVLAEQYLLNEYTAKLERSAKTIEAAFSVVEDGDIDTALEILSVLLRRHSATSDDKTLVADELGSILIPYMSGSVTTQEVIELGITHDLYLDSEESLNDRANDMANDIVYDSTPIRELRWALRANNESEKQACIEAALYSVKHDWN
jgi:hypothetical protein